MAYGLKVSSCQPLINCTCYLGAMTLCYQCAKYNHAECSIENFNREAIDITSCLGMCFVSEILPITPTMIITNVVISIPQRVNEDQLQFPLKVVVLSKSSFLFHLKNHHTKDADVNLKFQLKWSSHFDVRSICLLQLLCKRDYGYHNQARFH